MIYNKKNVNSFSLITMENKGTRDEKCDSEESVNFGCGNERWEWERNAEGNCEATKAAKGGADTAPRGGND